MIPTIKVGGGARERGRQYGEAARERVHRSLEIYQEAFGEYTGWAWARVREESEAFIPAIGAHDPTALDEMRGIAEGACLEESDVLAINVRTEIMFGAGTRSRDGAGDEQPRDGCSSLALVPPATADGHTLLAQNWDWIADARDTVVIVEARPDDAPASISIMEAGLLAKISLSASGVGVVTNTLITDVDRGRPGVPYHVCLRSLRHARTMADALAALQRSNRSSSANYLVGTDGLVFDAETWPGDDSCISLLGPARGRLLHTNHFMGPGFAGHDAGLAVMPDSPLRLQRLEARLAYGDGLSRADVEDALRDHVGYPYGVCSHPDRSRPRTRQEGTVLSVVMDLTDRRLWLTDGSPCSLDFRELDCSILAG